MIAPNDHEERKFILGPCLNTEKQPHSRRTSSIFVYKISNLLCCGLALMCILAVVYTFRNHDSGGLQYIRGAISTEMLLALSLQCTVAYSIFVASTAALGVVFVFVCQLRYRLTIWLYVGTYCAMTACLIVVCLTAMLQVHHIRDCAAKIALTTSIEARHIDFHRANQRAWTEQWMTRLDSCATRSGVFSLAKSYSRARPDSGNTYCSPHFTAQCVQDVLHSVISSSLLVFLQVGLLILGHVFVALDCFHTHRILLAEAARTLTEEETNVRDQSEQDHITPFTGIKVLVAK